MCGIAGLFDTRHPSEDLLRRHVTPMADCLRHRGPNDFGVWTDARRSVALGHTRLSILDLSEQGKQPMVSASGRYALVYNGEIYNFETLREELKKSGVVFSGHSDTEVMLALFEKYGLEVSLQKMTGMFAFALWDQKEESLYLVRDRMGEKPLYYGWAGPTFLFGSELKAFCKHPDFKKILNRDALSLYLRFSSVPAPYSIYRNIYKLPPASYLRISIKQPAGRLPEPVIYWSLKDKVEVNMRQSGSAQEPALLDELDHLLRDAVKKEMVSDVPLGAFLSGGIDSSLITTLMQVQSERKVKTFTIGFRDPHYDEAPHAKKIAALLKTEHTESYVEWRDALEVVPKLAKIYDEPFADASQIPTYLMCLLAKQHVTVALSGDGGDELFGGYSRYLWTRKVWGSWGKIPGRGLISMVLGAALPAWDMINFFLPGHFRSGKVKDRMLKMADSLNAAGPEEIYFRLMSHWPRPKDVLLNMEEPLSIMTDKKSWPDIEPLDRLMFFGAKSFLPDVMLTKVDRASMAAGLEVRAPLLDHHIVELAWKVPSHLKFKKGQGKWILRRLLDRYIPQNLVERPKMGFEAPLGQWLRGPLKSWADHLLDRKRLTEEGYFNAGAVRKVWAQHQAGTWDAHYYLWDILMFQAWHDEWMRQ